MSLRILDPRGRTLLHQDLPACPHAFLDAVAPFRDGLVVGSECVFGRVAPRSKLLASATRPASSEGGTRPFHRSARPLDRS